MKKLLFILLCLPMIGFGQVTIIRDANFEQALINLGYDNNLNGSVYTAMINTVTGLSVNNQSIYDLTGIEDFTALDTLDCNYNQLTTLDVSQNTALTWLNCNANQLTTLDVSGATALTYLECYNNQLTTLDVRNGNNTNFTYFNATSNFNLSCINVDDWQWSYANWLLVDAQQYFSNNCSGTDIEEHTTNKELLRTIDVLGRETKKQPLFYIYDDGTVEKRIVIE